MVKNKVWWGSFGMKLLNILPYFMIFLFPFVADAQTSSNGLTSFTGQMNTSVSLVFGYVKTGLTIGLLIWAIWLMYQAFFGHDKHGAWWQIVALIAFVILLNIFPSIYNAITGASVNVTTP
jgi:hypothetical protein